MSLLEIASGQALGTKERQEDYIEIKEFDDGAKLIVLADGMGGYKGGDIASRVVTQTFIQAFSESPRKNIDLEFKTALFSANEALLAEKEMDSELEDMGTTLVAVYIQNSVIQWVSVGDSPFWILRNGQLERLNEIHSYSTKLEKQLRDGKISQKDFDEDPNKHLLTSAIVGNEINKIEISNKFQIKDKDILLLASDGIETLNEEELINILTGKGRTRLTSSNEHSMLDIKEKMFAQIEYSYNGLESSRESTTALVVECYKEDTISPTTVLERYQDNTSMVLVKVQRDKNHDKKDSFFTDFKNFFQKYPFHMGVIFLLLSIFSTILIYKVLNPQVFKNKTENNISQEYNKTVKESKMTGTIVEDINSSIESEIELTVTINDNKIDFSEPVIFNGIKNIKEDIYIYGEMNNSKSFLLVLDNNLTKKQDIIYKDFPLIDIIDLNNKIYYLSSNSIFNEESKIKIEESKIEYKGFLKSKDTLFIYSKKGELFELVDNSLEKIEISGGNILYSINKDLSFIQKNDNKFALKSKEEGLIVEGIKDKNSFYFIEEKEFLYIKNDNTICLRLEGQQHCIGYFSRQKDINKITFLNKKDKKEYRLLITYKSKSFLVLLTLEKSKLKQVSTELENYGKYKSNSILGNKLIGGNYENNTSIMFKIVDLNKLN